MLVSPESLVPVAELAVVQLVTKLSEVVSVDHGSSEIVVEWVELLQVVQPGEVGGPVGYGGRGSIVEYIGYSPGIEVGVGDGSLGVSG
jgi:hypothetical protein